MRWLKYILLLVLALVSIVLLAALFVPKSMSVVKEITINKNADSVFNYIKLLKNQEAYSVWNLQEPNMQRWYRGTDGTEGFVAGWKGKKMGEGNQTITSLINNNRMESRIEFIKPFKSKADVYMIVTSNGKNSSTVAWGFDSKIGYPFNIMIPILGMQQEIAEDYGKGLANLKKILEK